MRFLSILLMMAIAFLPVQSDAFLKAVAGGSGGGGSGTVTNVTSSSPNITVTNGTTTPTLASIAPLNPQGTTTPYTVVSTDMGKTVTHNDASAVAVTLPQAGTTGFTLGSSFTDFNYNSGVVTITPTTSTINGASSLKLHKFGWSYPISDGTNWYAIGFPGYDTITSGAMVKFSSDTSGALTAATAGTDYDTASSTNTFTNKTFDTAGTGNVFKINGTQITAISGNTATAATTAGTLTSGHCVDIDASGNLADAGGACTTGGGGGTVSSGTAGQLGVYATTGTTISGLSGSNVTGVQGTGAKVQLSTGTTTTNDCVKFDVNGNTVDAGSACGSGGGGGVNPVLNPVSTYSSDTAGNIFPYVYIGSGGNASPSDAGWGVAASLAADVTLQLRFQMPPSIPSTGTFKLKSYCQTTATTGTYLYTASDAYVAAGSSPSAATLTADTQVSQAASAADIYMVNSTTLAETPSADGVSVVAVAFNHTSWTLAQILSCRFTETWE